MRATKWAAGLLAGAALLLAGGMLALTLALDAGTFTPRILAAIEAATGRTAALGAVSIRPGLTPRIVAEGASLANLPGAAAPEMARIRRVEARLALLPLLRQEVVIDRLLIEGAEIILERGADGAPNWLLRPPPRPAAPADPAAAAGPAARRWQASIGEVLLTDSRLRLPDARLGTITLAQARIGGLGTDRPVTIVARAGLLGLDAALEAELPPDGPLRARISFGPNRFAAEGRWEGPIRIAATLPDPAALRPLADAFAPGLPRAAVLPPIEASFTLDPAMRPGGMELRLGAADLSALVPDLALSRAELRAAALDQTAELVLEGALPGLPFQARLRIDTPAALLAAPGGTPLAFAAQVAAAGATARLEGRIAEPRNLTGTTIDLRLAVPDLAALAPALPDPPPLTDIVVEAQVSAPGRIDQELRIGAFRLASPLAGAEGSLVVRPGTPLGLTGRIAAGRIDLDTLTERLAARQGGAEAPAGPAPGAPAPRAPAPAAARVIPDIALPVAALRAYRGQLDISADHLIVGGTDWRQVSGVLALADDAARLTSFTAVTPGGPVRGEGTLEAAGPLPVVALALRSEGRGLDLGALRRARGEAAGIEGHAQIRIELRGRGATTRAVAGTLAGEAGVAMVEGRLARAGMLRLGPDLVALLLPGAPQEGLDLRCLALRISAEDGMATTQALLMETSAGRIEGMAAVNLRTEALAARLLPDITMFGVRVRAPVGIGGTLAAPRVGVEPGRALTQVIGDTVANRLWRDPTVEWLRGRVQGGSPGGDCAAQLRLARFGADGPLPPPERFVPVVPRELQGTTQDLLRGLGGALGGALGGIRR